MKFILEAFEGPLDLLLYLIKKNEIDIHDIPIAEITSQYMAYIGMMKLLNLDMAGEFLVMASTLIYIKSKVLIPREELSEEDIDVDPRRELVDQLLEYQKYKEIAMQLAQKEKERHDIFTRPEGEWDRIAEGEDANLGDVTLYQLLDAFSNVLDVIKGSETTLLEKEEFSVEEKIREILDKLRKEQSFSLVSLCKDMKTRIELVATFLALLELARLRELTLKQGEKFGDIGIEKTNSKENWSNSIF